MPDEFTAPGEAGQGGTPDAPGQAGQGIDYERAYGEIRPAYTQATQRLSEFEGLFAALHSPDPAVQAEAAELLGLQFAEDTGTPSSGAPSQDEEWIDPLEEEVNSLKQQLAEVTTWREQEASAKEAAEIEALRDDYISQSIQAIEAQVKESDPNFTGFSVDEEEIIGNLAISYADDDEVPDVQGAYERLYGNTGVLASRQAAMTERKRNAPQAPGGTTIPTDVRKQFNTPQGRIDYFDKRVRDLEDQF